MKSYAVSFLCDKCGKEIPLRQPVNLCPACGGLLETQYDLPAMRRDNALYKTEDKDASIWRYRPLLPPLQEKNIISLGEGGTPLTKSVVIGPMLGMEHLYFKNDTLMPTGSFKDRGFSLAVSYAKEIGVRRGFTYSSGNAGASFSAYSSRGNFDALVLVEYQASDVKKSMLTFYGVTAVELYFDDFSQITQMLDYGVQELGLYQFVNFINPVRHEAMKTYAYEIHQQLGRVPDYMLHPVGTGGGLWGTWKGFQELSALGVTNSLPKMIAVQPEEVCWIKQAFDQDKSTGCAYGDGTKTIAQSISGNAPIQDGSRLLACVRDSGGGAEGVSDAAILEAMRLLAREGIAAEPSSAAAVAAYIKRVQSGLIRQDETAVCVITGTALKQPGAVIKAAGKSLESIHATGSQLKELANRVFGAKAGES